MQKIFLIQSIILLTSKLYLCLDKDNVAAKNILKELRMKLLIAFFMVSMMPLSLLAIENAKEIARAPRPDALSYPGSTPEIVSPFDTAQLAQIRDCVCQLKILIESGFDFIISQFDVVIEIIGSKVDVIESQIDELLACASTPITTAIVITVPGTYCLANDITGTIEIAVSGVTLDLNDHQILGNILVDSNLSNISVGNGVITQMSLSPTNGIDILDGCDFVSIYNMFINNVSTGINLQGTIGNFIKNLDIRDVSIENCQANGIFVTNCQGSISNFSIERTIGGPGLAIDSNDEPIKFEQGIIEGCSTSGIFINNARNITLKHIQVLNNIGNGISIQNASLVTCFESSSIGNNDFGFNIDGSAFIAYSCQAVSNANPVVFFEATGFSYSDGARVYLENCSAIGNQVGFATGDETVLGCIKSGVALLNSQWGFLAPSTANPNPASNVSYVGNFSVNNGPFANQNYGFIDIRPNIDAGKGKYPYYYANWRTGGVSYLLNLDGNNG